MQSDLRGICPNLNCTVVSCFIAPCSLVGGCRHFGVKYCPFLAFIFRHLNPTVAADSRSYLHFKCPSLHLSGAAFSLSSINRYF